MMRLSLLLLLLSFISGAIAEEYYPERRKSQFATDTGYYIIPSPYSIPGIGDGLIAVGAMTNGYNTYSDIFGYVATGDLEGVGLISADNHLIEKTLIADISVVNFNKASIQTYRQRGMDSSPDDYLIAELGNSYFAGARLTYTWLDRRVEVYGLAYHNKAKLDAIRDADGNLIAASTDGEEQSVNNYTMGMRLDFTDDYSDPRRGIRLESSIWDTPPDNGENSADFSILELNLTGYIPFFKHDTLVLNYFQADASVSATGETDPAVVEGLLGLDCASLSGQDQLDCQSYVNTTVAENTYGSVGSLGGLSRLRAFPGDRFRGSHSRFYGIEYRWNFIEQSKPFDFIIAKDVRTSMQLALFYERGAISDFENELWNNMRWVAGAGFRLITSSGLTFRADIATGDEGKEVSVIVGYPWEVF